VSTVVQLYWLTHSPVGLKSQHNDPPSQCVSVTAHSHSFSCSPAAAAAAADDDDVDDADRVTLIYRCRLHITSLTSMKIIAKRHCAGIWRLITVVQAYDATYIRPCFVLLLVSRLVGTGKRKEQRRNCQEPLHHDGLPRWDHTKQTSQRSRLENYSSCSACCDWEASASLMLSSSVASSIVVRVTQLTESLYRVNVKVTPCTVVDILAMRADFCMKFYTTVKQ